MTDLLDQDVDAWVPNLADFGSRLAIIRWAMRWNIKEAAAACDLPGQSWRQWEVGGMMPRDVVAVVEKICARTGVDFIWMLTGAPRRGAEVLHDLPVERREGRRLRSITGQGPGRANRRRVTEEYARHPADNRPAAGPGSPSPRRTVRAAA